MFLCLVKKTALQFLFTVLYKRGFEPPTSQSVSKEKSRNIANIGIQSYITKFSQKCFILSVYCTALCTERCEPPHSLSTSKKKLGHITILIFGLIILNLVKKLFYTSILLHYYTSILFYCTGCLKET